jgi:hypothetical protein
MLEFTVKTEKKTVTIQFNIEDVKGVRGGYGCRCCKIIWKDKDKEPFNTKMYNKQLRMWFLEKGHEVNVV